MKKIADYERHAAECRQLAAEMKNPQQRKQLEDMADVWDRLARERRQGIVENNRDQAQPQTGTIFIIGYSVTGSDFRLYSAACRRC